MRMKILRAKGTGKKTGGGAPAYKRMLDKNDHVQKEDLF